MYLIRIHTSLGLRYLAPLALMLAVVACSLAGHTTMCSEAPWRIEALCCLAQLALMLAVVACSLAGHTTMCSGAPWRIEALCYPALEPVLRHPPSIQDLVYQMLAVMVDEFKAFCENVYASCSLHFIAAPTCQ